MPFDLRSGDIPVLLRQVNPSAIIPLAGHAVVADSTAQPRCDLETNLLPPPLLVVSTGAVYGSHASHPFTERDPVFPVTPYAVAKLASARYGASYAAV